MPVARSLPPPHPFPRLPSRRITMSLAGGGLGQWRVKPSPEIGGSIPSIRGCAQGKHASERA